MFSFLIHLLIQFHLLTLSIFYNRFDKATTFIEPFLWPVGVAVGDLCSHLQWYVVGMLIPRDLVEEEAQMQKCGLPKVLCLMSG